MGTISIGGMLVEVPDETNNITISKNSSGKYVVVVNNNTTIYSFIRVHTNYNIEIYDINDKLICAGLPPNFTVIISDITYDSFTTIAAIYAKLIELIELGSQSGSSSSSSLIKFPLVGTDGDFVDGERTGSVVEFVLPNDVDLDKDMIFFDGGEPNYDFTTSLVNNIKYITFTVAPLTNSVIYYQI